MLLVHRHSDVRAVMADEFSSRIVEAQTMLSTAGFRAKIRRVPWIKRKIAAAHADAIRASRHMHPSAHRSARAVDPVVERPIETIEQPLDIEPLLLFSSGILRESSEDQFLYVSDAVVVGIFEIPDVRGRADEYTAIVT